MDAAAGQCFWANEIIAGNNVLTTPKTAHPTANADQIALPQNLKKPNIETILSLAANVRKFQNAEPVL